MKKLNMIILFISGMLVMACNNPSTENQEEKKVDVKIELASPNLVIGCRRRLRSGKIRKTLDPGLKHAGMTAHLVFGK